jgi:hypothetical protein
MPLPLPQLQKLHVFVTNLTDYTILGFKNKIPVRLAPRIHQNKLKHKHCQQDKFTHSQSARQIKVTHIRIYRSTTHSLVRHQSTSLFLYQARKRELKIIQLQKKQFKARRTMFDLFIYSFMSPFV